MKHSLFILALILTCLLPARSFAQSTTGLPWPADGSSSSNTPSAEEQQAKTTEGPNNVAFRNVDAAAGQMKSASEQAESQTRGIQFKNAVLAPEVEYRWTDDTSPGGFSGNEVSGSIAVDADVWDGLIMGLVYGHTHRDTESSLGVSEHLDSDAVSLYGARRFFNLLNVGLAYNYANTRDQLTRALVYNMDRESNGGTAFAGLSDRMKKWNWSSTASFAYVFDDYDFSLIKDRTTGRFGFSNTLGYDVTKTFNLGAAISYYNFFHQDPYGTVFARDDDYWMLGPRLTFYPMDNLTVHFGFDSQQGYKDLTAYVARLGVNINF